MIPDPNPGEGAAAGHYFKYDAMNRARGPVPEQEFLASKTERTRTGSAT